MLVQRKRIQEFADQLVRRSQTLRAKKDVLNTHCQEIADRIYPEAGQFTVRRTPGEKRMQLIYDSIPIQSNQILAAGLYSLLTSSTQQWFESVAYREYLNDIKSVAEWLDEVGKIMFVEMNRPVASFMSASHECYLDYGAFGNLCMFASEDIEGEHLRFEAWPFYTTLFANGATGQVNTVFRQYQATNQQLREEFGKDNLPEKVLDQIKNHKWDIVNECLYCVMPKEYVGIKSGMFPYVGVHVELKQKHIMGIKGFKELPVFAARHHKSAHEDYGRGAGSTALPDVKMLYEVVKTNLRAAQKIVDPALALPYEGLLNKLRTHPGGINYYQPSAQFQGSGIEAIGNEGRPDIGLDLIQDIRQRVRETFYVDKLELSEGPPQMTATEVIQRTEQKLRLMGPMIGRLQTELLGPMLNRVFGLLYRMGKFPPTPPELLGEDLKFIYISPIARAQEQIEANGIMRAVEVLRPFVEAQPQITHNFNGDELARGVWRMFSNSPKYLNSKAEVNSIRQAERQQMEQEQMPGMVRDIGQGAQSLSQAGVNVAGMLPEGNA